MNFFQHLDSLRKLVRFGFRATGYVATVGLAAFLILVWILTEPLLHWGVYLSDFIRMRFNPTMKGKL